MRKVIMLACLVAISGPALANDKTDKSAKKQLDPNRIICRSEEEIGSRLQTQRTCMTAMQWADVEREQRRTVERVQQYKPAQGN